MGDETPGSSVKGAPKLVALAYVRAKDRQKPAGAATNGAKPDDEIPF